MGYPAKLLGADERVVVSVRPHWKTLVAPTVVFITTSAVATYLALVVPEGDWRLWLRLAIVVVWLLIVVAWALRPLLVWWYTQYTITNKRLIMRSGVLSRSGHDVPLQRISDVSFERTWFERILDSGTLHVESTSERGPIRLVDIPHVEDLQRDLNELTMLEAQQRFPSPSAERDIASEEPIASREEPISSPDDERRAGG